MTTPTTFIVEFRRGKRGDVVAFLDSGKVAFPERRGPQPEVGDQWEVTVAGENPAGTVAFLRLHRRISTAAEREEAERRAQAALLAEFGVENLPPEWEVVCADLRARSVEIKRSDLRWRDDRLYRYRGRFPTPAWRGEWRKRFDDPTACRAWLAVAIPEWESAIALAMADLAAYEQRCQIEARLRVEAKRIAEQVLAREDLFLAGIQSGAWYDAPDGSGRWRVVVRDPYYEEKPYLVQDMAIEQEGGIVARICATIEVEPSSMPGERGSVPHWFFHRFRWEDLRDGVIKGNPSIHAELVIQFGAFPLRLRVEEFAKVVPHGARRRLAWGMEEAEAAFARGDLRWPAPEHRLVIHSSVRPTPPPDSVAVIYIHYQGVVDREADTANPAYEWFRRLGAAGVPGVWRGLAKEPYPTFARYGHGSPVPASAGSRDDDPKRFVVVERALLDALAAAGIPAPSFTPRAPEEGRITWSVTTGGTFNVPPEDRWHEGASAAVYELPVETHYFSAKAACYEGWPWEAEGAAEAIAMAKAALGLEE